MSPAVRDATEADLPGIAAIYAHHVRTGLASFETEPPDEAEMRARFEAVCAKGFPYLACEIGGRGIGRALLARLIERCEAIGCRQLVAVIGDSRNTASIGLHSALGFRMAGTLRSIGFKHGRWVDSVLMQRAIGPGDSSPPES